MTVARPSGTPISGSPRTGEPEYLVVGRLQRPHGVMGEILMRVVTDFPERLKGGTEVFLGPEHKPAMIADARSVRDGLLIRFDKVESREAAAALRNLTVWVPASNRPALPKGYYYHHELIRSTVVDEQSNILGELAEIIETGANDVYVVRNAQGQELLLPGIPGVLLGIDAVKHQVEVRVPEGLSMANAAGNPDPAGGRQNRPRIRRRLHGR